MEDKTQKIQDDNNHEGGGDTELGKKEEQPPPIVKDDIFYRISKDNEPGVLDLLTKDKNLVNILDEHGMTPLQHGM